jgi:hypothetical protein
MKYRMRKYLSHIKVPTGEVKTKISKVLFHSVSDISGNSFSHRLPEYVDWDSMKRMALFLIKQVKIIFP